MFEPATFTSICCILFQNVYSIDCLYLVKQPVCVRRRDVLKACIVRVYSMCYLKFEATIQKWYIYMFSYSSKMVHLHVFLQFKNGTSKCFLTVQKWYIYMFSYSSKGYIYMFSYSSKMVHLHVFLQLKNGTSTCFLTVQKWYI